MTEADRSRADMRLAMFVTFAVLAGLAIVGVIVLLLFRPEASATFTSFVLTLLAIVTTAAGTFYGLVRTNNKLEVVKTQTNGTLSKLLQENRNLTNENIRLRDAAAMPPIPAMRKD